MARPGRPGSDLVAAAVPAVPAVPVDRAEALRRLLDAVVEGTVHAYLDAPQPPVDAAWGAGLTTLARTWVRQWEPAVCAGAAAVDRADAAACWLQIATVGWASSGDLAVGSDDLVRATTGADLPNLDDELQRFAAYLLVEALMAHARLDIAEQLVERLGPGLWDQPVLGGHPFMHMVRVCRIRLAAFRGDLALATAVPLLAGAQSQRLAALTAATDCLVRGNEADPGEVRRLAAHVSALMPDADDVVGAGCHMLVSFGLVAVGEVAEAARRVLLAGGDAALSGLNIIDRALGLELLVALALADEDVDAAEAWRDQAGALALSPIASSTVARVNSRVALAVGAYDEAVEWGEHAVALAAAADRRIEVAEGEIVLSRARLARHRPGDSAAATRSLTDMVAEAERRGHRAPRRSATRELRPIGRRLQPAAGVGWTGLSGREAEVARLVADGLGNRQVARALDLTEHTVRSHVSRVLAAFGVASRSGLPGAMGTGGPMVESAALTARQLAVASAVARGASNATIAADLGISSRTVEKHVAEILRRWGLPSRTALAAAVLSQETTPTRPL